MMHMTDEAVARDHWEADSSKLGPNLEGIQSTVITRGKHTGYYNGKIPEYIFWGETV